MDLEALPPELLELLSQHVVGVVEGAGLRGVSVVARELAQLAQSSKLFLPLVLNCWRTLSNQTPVLFHQFGINDILQKYDCLHFLGQQRIQGPVNLRNVSPVPQKHSPGLQALGWLEKDSLERHLSQTNGPLATLPLRAGLKHVRAPLQVKLMVAGEKCQHSWRTPSPLWTSLEFNGARPLEAIDMVRELLTDRPDRGVRQDEEMSSLLAKHYSDWPYGQYNRNTWWGFRKLICDNWSPADIQRKQEARREAAQICLHCMGPAHRQCPQFCCKQCCTNLRLACWLHNTPWRAKPCKRKSGSRR